MSPLQVGRVTLPDPSSQTPIHNHSIITPNEAIMYDLSVPFVDPPHQTTFNHYMHNNKEPDTCIY